MGAVTEVALTGYGEFPDLARSIRALLFGELVKRATPVVKEYHSDLFHDAEWIQEHVDGPTTFDWMARTSGTNIGESARIGVEIGAPGGVFYEVELRSVRGMWKAIFTNIPLDQVLTRVEGGT